MNYKTLNPFTRVLIKEYEPISDKELEEALKKAEQAFPDWSGLPLKRRLEVISQAAELLRKNPDFHARIISLEMGKPIKQSKAEVEKCAWLCDYFIENSARFLEAETRSSTAGKSLLLFQPLGVIYAVMPWNFPYWQVFRFLVPNLVAGNTGILKHASHVPACGEAIDILIRNAGGREGVFQNLFVNYEQSDRIIGHPAVKGVTLTGSNPAGYHVAEIAGKEGKKTVLELGGSDPFIVFEDAHLDEAVKTGIIARFQNTGQSCIAAKRFFIQDKVFNAYVEKFAEQASKQKAGDPVDEHTEIGPMARKDLLEELERQVHRMLNSGARLVSGGKRIWKDKLFYEPTILEARNLSDEVYREEIFGPVAVCTPFKDEKEVVQLANGTPFGLGANVWSGDEARAMRVAGSLQAGTVAINGMVKSEPNMPFGGVKASGYGRELCEYGMKEFLNIKSVNVF